MSIDLGNFEPLTGTTDEEVQHLYRLRDNDPSMKDKKPLFNNMLEDNRDSPIKESFLTKLVKPVNDEYWNSLTEEQRIEHGVISKYMLRNISLLSIVGITAFSFYQYEKIFYPSGIVLRRQRKEGIVRYLSRRLPLVLFGSFVVYNLKIYPLRYMIDYYSDEEGSTNKI